LLGAHFSAADVVIGSGLTWGMMTKALPERPEFVAYAARLRERPALQRVYAKDAELAAAQAA
jgi:glutathione S-transferase